MDNKEIDILIGGIELKGILVIPPDAKGIILFAHGSGSSRLSPRNNFVADVLNKNGFATLLADLLTEEEDAIYDNRFNIDLLTERLGKVADHLSSIRKTHKLPLGLFGSSTGAAAALNLASIRKDIFAVVSRGGRPDLAGKNLTKVSSPTLLIVGGDDVQVLELNERSLEEMGSRDKQLVVIPGATHLFEESGALESVARYATDWFTRYAKR